MTTSPIKIYISGYPQDYDELQLVQLVSSYGEVSTIKIVRHKQTGRAKSYAFIEMVSLKAAEDAVIALDGLEIKDKTLTVNIVEEKLVLFIKKLLLQNQSGHAYRANLFFLFAE